MSEKSKWDYLKAIYYRYKKVSKALRARILDEFCQVCGYHRKYAIRLLSGPVPQKSKTMVRTAVQKQMLSISPAIIDRRLKAKKHQLKKRLYGCTKPGTLLKHHIPIKTDSWDVKTPGFTKIDLISHSGNSASGEFLHSLNVTDIHSTWVESRAVMGKGRIALLSAMMDIEQALPFELSGIDSDNGSEFINHHLKTFCDQTSIQFTRCRPYK